MTKPTKSTAEQVLRHALVVEAQQAKVLEENSSLLKAMKDALNNSTTKADEKNQNIKLAGVSVTFVVPTKTDTNIDAKKVKEKMDKQLGGLIAKNEALIQETKKLRQEGMKVLGKQNPQVISSHRSRRP